jgi:hypothetical protein
MITSKLRTFGSVKAGDASDNHYIIGGQKFAERVLQSIMQKAEIEEASKESIIKALIEIKESQFSKEQLDVIATTTSCGRGGTMDLIYRAALDEIAKIQIKKLLSQDIDKIIDDQQKSSENLIGETIRKYQDSYGNEVGKILGELFYERSEVKFKQNYVYGETGDVVDKVGDLAIGSTDGRELSRCNMISSYPIIVDLKTMSVPRGSEHYNNKSFATLVDDILKLNHNFTIDGRGSNLTATVRFVSVAVPPEPELYFPFFRGDEDTRSMTISSSFTSNDTKLNSVQCEDINLKPLTIKPGYFVSSYAPNRRNVSEAVDIDKYLEGKQNYSPLVVIQIVSQTGIMKERIFRGNGRSASRTSNNSSCPVTGINIYFVVPVRDMVHKEMAQKMQAVCNKLFDSTAKTEVWIQSDRFRNVGTMLEEDLGIKTPLTEWRSRQPSNTATSGTDSFGAMSLFRVEQSTTNIS